jgi:hypothetical protein
LALAALGILVAVAPAFGQSPSVAPSVIPSVAPSTAPGESPAPSRSDPRCDPFLTADQVEETLGDLTVTAVEFFDNRPGEAFGHITCTWVAGPGQDVFLDVDDLKWSGQPFLINKHAGGTPIPDLGDDAYAVTESGSNYVAWASRIGDTDRTLLLYGYERPFETLIALATLVASDATLGAAPATTAPGSPSADAAALVGTWLVTGWSEGELPAKPPVTFTFDADGGVVVAVDCKPAKGSKKPVKRASYTATSDSLEIASGGWTGACRANADRDFLQTLGFVAGMAAGPGAWSLTGDTLSIEGSMAPGSLTLTRVAAP